MKCPKCKLENPQEALRCDCGYDFSSGTMKESFLQKSGSENKLYAGFWSRLSAILLDAVITYSVWIILSKLLNFKSSSVIVLLCYLGLNLIFILYEIIFSVKFGSTIGKLILKIKIVDESGLNITYMQAILRRIYLYATSLIAIIVLSKMLWGMEINKLPNSFKEIGTLLSSNNFYKICNIGVSICLCIDFFTILFNQMGFNSPQLAAFAN